MATQSRQVETPDGRTLRVEVSGDGDRVVVAHVGTPNACVLYEPWIEDAAGRGLTLVTYDRPGYGGSTRLDGRTVADCVDDMRAISQALRFERCAVWGFSGGGPHALACAALLTDLVAAAASIGSLAPADIPGSTTSRGWSARTAPTSSSSAPTGSFGAWLHRAMLAGIRPSADGWIDDSVAFNVPWGVDPAAIAVPVKLWHGVDDRFVPVEHARWLAANIPGAETDIRAGDGHLRVAALRIGDVHEWLARRAWPSA